MESMPVQNATQDMGKLRVRVNSMVGDIPIANARVKIFNPDEPENVIEELVTDEDGLAEPVSLETPPLEYSLTPGANQPYATYSLDVTAPDYDQQIITGAQILPDTAANTNEPSRRENCDWTAYVIWRLSTENSRGGNQAIA